MSCLERPRAPEKLLDINLIFTQVPTDHIRRLDQLHQYRRGNVEFERRVGNLISIARVHN